MPRLRVVEHVDLRAGGDGGGDPARWHHRRNKAWAPSTTGGADGAQASGTVAVNHRPVAIRGQVARPFNSSKDTAR